MPAVRARFGKVIEGSTVIPPKVAPKPDVDESLWRESSISPRKTIKKTEAQKEYSLTKAEIETLQCVKRAQEALSELHRHDVQLGSMYIKSKKFVYQEREVERLAWRKFGGPEGFETHKAQLEENRARRALTSPPKPPRKPRKPSKEMIRKYTAQGYVGDDDY